MRKHLFRLAIASSAALLAFIMVGLLTAYFASHAGDSPILKYLPDASVVQARFMISPEIQTELPLATSLRVVTVSGHLGCEAGENVRVVVNLTQDSTQAHAKGSSLEPCTAELQIWDAVAVARGSSPAFEPGAALACAWATTRKGGKITDEFRWCVQVTLVLK